MQSRHALGVSHEIGIEQPRLGLPLRHCQNGITMLVGDVSGQ
jgi:hypothetical protein